MTPQTMTAPAKPSTAFDRVATSKPQTEMTAPNASQEMSNCADATGWSAAMGDDLGTYSDATGWSEPEQP
jgi:hypothetical protein